MQVFVTLKINLALWKKILFNGPYYDIPHAIGKVHIFSEATKFCEIFTLLLTVCTEVQSKVKISQNLWPFQNV